MKKHLTINGILLVCLLAFQARQVYAEDANLSVPNSSAIPNGTAIKQSERSGSNDDARSELKPSPSNHSGLCLILAGGGARGAAHIGVLKVLDAAGICPDFISGSSIGAMIGGLYAAGVPVSEIERLCLSGELKKAFFPSDRRLQAVTYLGPYMLARTMHVHPGIGLYSGKSISKFVSKHLPAGVTKIEDMPIHFSAAAVDLTTTRAVWLSKGSIADAIRASNSMPGFYRPVRVGEQVLVDGGVRENLPTEIAEGQGAPIVVAVRLQAYLEKVDQREYDSMMNYGDRVDSILLSEIENKAVGKADIMIEPKLPWMKMTSFKKEELKSAIEAGEVAARKALPKIRAYETESARHAALTKPI